MARVVFLEVRSDKPEGFTINKEVQEWQGDVKSAEKARFQETMFPIQTDIQEESGTPTSRQ